MNVGDLFVGLHIDGAAFQSELTGVMRNAGTQASKSFSDNFKVAAGAVGVIGTAIAGIGLKAAIDWESAFTGVEKTVDATDEELKQLEGTLRAMAGPLGTSAVELAGLAEQAGALGIRTPDIAEFVRISAMLGVTTDVSAGMAATALGKINAVIPLTSAEMGRFASTLVELGAEGSSTESQIIDMAQNMAGAAQVVGMSVPQMLSWAAAAANVGIEAEAGSSSFQRLALGVQEFVVQGGPKLAEIARLTGMTGDEFKELFSRDASAAMQAIIGGLAEMDGNTRAATLAALGFTDIRLTKYLLTLSANQGNLNKALTDGASAWDDNTAMGVEFAKRTEDTAFQIEALKADLNETAIIIGEALLPHVKNLVSFLRDAAQAVGNWMRENKGLVDTLTPILAVLSGILALKWGGNFLGMLLGQLGLGGLGSGLLRAILPAATAAGTSAGAAQAGAHATAATGPGLVTRMVAGLVTATTPMSLAGTTAGTAVGAAFAAALVAAVVVGIVAIKVAAGELVKAVDDARLKLRELAAEEAFTPEQLAQLRDAGTYGEHLGNTLRLLIPGFQDAGTEMAAFGREAQDVGNGVVTVFAETGTAAGQGWAQANLDAIRGFDWGAGAPAAADAARTVAEAGQIAMLDSWRNADWGAAAVAAADALLIPFRELGASIPGQIGQGMQSTANQVLDAAQGLRDLLKNGLTPQERAMEVIGADFIKLVRKGMNSQIDGAKETAQTVAIAAIDTIEDAGLTGKKGHKGLEQIGRLYDQLLASGMTKEEAATALKAAGVAETTIAAMSTQKLQNSVETGGGKIGDAWVDGVAWALRSGINEIDRAGWAALGGIMGHSPPKRGPLRFVDKWGENVGSAWLDGVKKGISGVGPLLTAAGGAVFSMGSFSGGATVQLHHTVDIRGDSGNLDNRKVADYLNEGAAGFAWNLEHAMSAVTSG